MALSEKYRLKKREDIALVYRKGRKVTGQYLILRILSVPQNKTQIAFIIGRKAVKKAVLRNRLKRVLSGFWQKKLQDLSGGKKIIVEIKPAHSFISLAEIDKMKNKMKKEMILLLKKQGIFIKQNK